MIIREAGAEALPHAALDPVADQALVGRAALERFRGEGVPASRAVLHSHDHAASRAVLADDGRLRACVRPLTVPGPTPTLEVLGKEHVRRLDCRVDRGGLLLAAGVPLDDDVIQHRLIAVHVESLEHKMRGPDGRGVVALRVETVADREDILDVVPLVVVVHARHVVAAVVGGRGRPDVVVREAGGEALPGPAARAVADQAGRGDGAIEGVARVGVAAAVAAGDLEDKHRESI